MICPKLTLSIAVCLNWSISSQDELDWGEAGVLRSEIHQNKIHHIHAAKFRLHFNIPWIVPVPVRTSILRWVSNFKNTSFCLEINHFGETATGSVKLGLLLRKKLFLQEIQWHHQNWNALSHFYFITVWNVCQLDVPDPVYWFNIFIYIYKLPIYIYVYIFNIHI